MALLRALFASVVLLFALKSHALNHTLKVQAALRHLIELERLGVSAAPVRNLSRLAGEYSTNYAQLLHIVDVFLVGPHQNANLADQRVPDVLGGKKRTSLSIVLILRSNSRIELDTARTVANITAFYGEWEVHKSSHFLSTPSPNGLNPTSLGWETCPLAGEWEGMGGEAI